VKRPTTAIIFVVLFAGLAYLFTPRVMRLWELNKRNDALEVEILSLKKDNAMLENEIKLLTNDPVYLEKIARAKFKKARENEIVYKVVKEETQ
jgi:cell division protein FtsB